MEKQTATKSKKRRPLIHYVVGGVWEERDVSYAGFKSTIKMTWADGMVGVMPVFSNKRKAEKYAKRAGSLEIAVFEAAKQGKK